MSATDGIDIVVINYKTPRDLRFFISSWEQCRREVATSLHIGNVQPEREDLDLAFAFEYALPNVHHTYWTRNLGYARACNALAATGRREVIALFNADTILCPGVLEECHAALMEHDDWAVVGPRQVDGAGQITHAGIFGSQANPRHRGWKEADAGNYLDVLEAVTVSGSAYFVRRDAWTQLTACPIYQAAAANMGEEAVGAFLPVFHYWNETWTSYHAQAHGWKVVYYGAVTMVHRWHQASPVGGAGELAMPEDQASFRMACDLHGIPHD